MTYPEWPEERRQRMFALRDSGFSAGEIAKTMGTTRNTIIGQLARHRAPKIRRDPETARTGGAAGFDGPSPPRRFSWEMES